MKIWEVGEVWQMGRWRRWEKVKKGRKRRMKSSRRKLRNMIMMGGELVTGRWRSATAPPTGVVGAMVVRSGLDPGHARPSCR